MIRSFRCQETQDLFERRRSRRFAAVQRVIERKLVMPDSAVQLGDLRWAPGNRLEALVGDRKRQHSIRGNGQFRVCFRWTDAGAEDVEVVDYH